MVQELRKTYRPFCGYLVLAIYIEKKVKQAFLKFKTFNKIYFLQSENIH